MGNAMSCLSGEERQFTGEGPPPKAVYLPNLLPSRWLFYFFKISKKKKKEKFSLSLFILFLSISLFFCCRYYWLLQEQLFPSILPFRITILTGRHTGCWWRCGVEESQSSAESDERRPAGLRDRTEPGPVRSSPPFPPPCLHLFASLLIQLFIHLFIPLPRRWPACFGFRFQSCSLAPLEINKASFYLFIFCQAMQAEKNPNCNRIMK